MRLQWWTRRGWGWTPRAIRGRADIKLTFPTRFSPPEYGSQNSESVDPGLRLPIVHSCHPWRDRAHNQVKWCLTRPSRRPRPAPRPLRRRLSTTAPASRTALRMARRLGSRPRASRPAGIVQTGPAPPLRPPYACRPARACRRNARVRPPASGVPWHRLLLRIGAGGGHRMPVGHRAAKPKRNADDLSRRGYGKEGRLENGE